jgi:hypothetical protein
MALTTRTPAEKARHTDRWTEIIFKAVTAKISKRWRLVSFRGFGGGEWRGVVDVVAIRKSTTTPSRVELKAGDLFDIILIQMKGGHARRPDLAERRRLAAVGKEYKARAVVLFEWTRGERTQFSVLNRALDWEPVSCTDVFGA